MINIPSFNKSLIGTWIKECLDSENSGKWENIFNSDSENMGAALILKEILI